MKPVLLNGDWKYSIAKVTGVHIPVQENKKVFVTADFFDIAGKSQVLLTTLMMAQFD